MTGYGTQDERRHPKTTRHDSRRGNLRATLELVSEHGATSRAEIARETGLSRAAVSSLVAELIDDDLLRELGRGISAGGKPPTLLALNERGREIVALDLGHRPFMGALVDLSGRIHERVVADETPSPTGEGANEVVISMIEALTARATAPVLGVGVGAPGVVGPEGRIMESANLDWHGLDLATELESRFELPVTIANDAAMAAMAEFRRRPSARDLILVKIGRGIGAGIVLGGTLFRGPNSAAGEIGHVRVVEGGLRCRCGHDGCLETVASVPAVLESLGVDPEDQPWDALTLAGAFGEEAVRDAIAMAGRYVGKALAAVVATVDVGHLVVASELLNAGDILIGAMRDELAGRVLPSTSDWIEIEGTQLGADLVLKGAASAVLVDRLGAVLR